MSSLFITKGMKLNMKEFKLSVTESGEIETKKMTIHTGLDMCPYWIDIAYAHLLKTENIHKQLLEAKEKKQNAIAVLLKKEFTSGMQAIMAACIAIDAYYASIKEYADIPKEMSQKWKEKGTARYKQIAETLKRTFLIPQTTFLKIREILQQCFDLRDRAVHPKAGTDAPVLHPEAGIISDWRYSAFRFANAKAAVGYALSITYQTARQENKKINTGLKTICEKHKKDLDPILSKWIKRYGELFE
jgi:hypothetical protein